MAIPDLFVKIRLIHNVTFENQKEGKDLRKERNLLILLLTLLMVAAAALVLFFSFSWSGTTHGEVTAKEHRFAALYTGDNGAFISELERGLSTAARENNLWVSFESFNSSDVTSHLSAFQRVIDSGVDGIITNLPDVSDIGRLIDNAALESIPVATIVDDFYGSQRRVHIGVDYLLFGKQAAQMLTSLKRDGARTAVISYPLEKQTLECQKKVQGFVQGLGGERGYYVGIENVRTLNQVDAYELTRELLGSSFGYDSFFCIDETLTLAVAQCLQDMNAKDLFVVGCGESTAVYEYLKDGTIDAVLTENPYSVGYEAVSELKRYITDGGMPYISEAEIRVVTRENLQEFVYEEVVS